MSYCYLILGIKFRNFVQLLSKNKVSFKPKYLLRLLFIAQNSLWSSFFSLIEKGKYGKKLKALPTPEDIIIIVGHWRTGSTYLHQLFTQDPQVVYPTLFQVANPDHFLVSEKILLPIVKAALVDKRPMDNVRLSHNSPEDDEYALYRMTNFSMLNELIFCKGSKYFPLNYENFIPLSPKNIAWKEKMVLFYKKLLVKNPGKTIVLKNSIHSMRIKELKEIFPKARFIHIYRNPYKIIPSTINMWNIVAKQNALNSNWTSPAFEEVVEFFNQVTDCIQSSLSDLPLSDYYEIGFETCVKNPLSELEKIYQHFHIDFSSEFRKNIETFTYENRNYQKNVFQLSPEEKELINRKSTSYMKRYGYTDI